MEISMFITIFALAVQITTCGDHGDFDCKPGDEEWIIEVCVEPPQAFLETQKPIVGFFVNVALRKDKDSTTLDICSGKAAKWQDRAANTNWCTRDKFYGPYPAYDGFHWPKTALISGCYYDERLRTPQKGLKVKKVKAYFQDNEFGYFVPDGFITADCNEQSFVLIGDRYVELVYSALYPEDNCLVRDDCPANSRCRQDGPGKSDCVCEINYVPIYDMDDESGSFDAGPRKCQPDVLYRDHACLHVICQDGASCDSVNPEENPDQFTCLCDKGFQMQDDGITTKCEDIDECENDEHTCLGDEVCYNTIGGFACEIPSPLENGIF